MNWFTGMPLSTWTFLKTSSAISGFCAGWLVAAPPPSRNYVVEQIAIEVAISAGPSIVGPQQHQNTGPCALHHQRRAWNVGSIHYRCATEEQTITGHREVGARAREHQAVHASKSRDHN